MKKSGATPRKLALVAVLAVVLVAVIAGQLPSRSAAPQLVSRNSSSIQSKLVQPEPKIAAELQPVSPEVPAESAEQSPTEPTTRDWPKLTMDSILSYDPLAEPDWLVQARNTTPPVDEATRLAAEAERQRRKEEILQQLREQGARAVVFSGNDKRAAIGNQSVRIGETIGGLRITEITRAGIVLTEYESQ